MSVHKPSMAMLAAALALAMPLGSPAAAQSVEKPAAAAKPAAKARVSQADIDLWAFSVMRALAPGKSLAEFRTLPNLGSEKVDDLLASDDPKDAAGPRSVRFLFNDGMDLRVMDYGNQAFVSHLRVNGPEHVLLDELKIGSSRAQVEAVLGKPTRGGARYTVYEGKDDVVRFYYTDAGTISAVEIDRGG